MNYTDYDDLLRVHNVRAISIDSKGNKWLGTTYGIVKLEDQGINGP